MTSSSNSGGMAFNDDGTKLYISQHAHNGWMGHFILSICLWLMTHLPPDPVSRHYHSKHIR